MTRFISHCDGGDEGLKRGRAQVVGRPMKYMEEMAWSTLSTWSEKELDQAGTGPELTGISGCGRTRDSCSAVTGQAAAVRIGKGGCGWKCRQGVETLETLETPPMTGESDSGVFRKMTR